VKILWIVLALLVWAALSYAFIFVFAGSHVCALVQPVGGSPTATPIPIEVLTARCNRPDIGAIAASVVGLAAIVLVTVGTWRGRLGAR
jgi:hypothetical protein